MQDNCTPEIVPIINKRMIDLAGKRFGRLVVLGYTGKQQQGKTKIIFVPTWLCLCDCGNRVLVEGGNLKSGKSQSCGCVRAENLINNPPSFIHGGTYMTEYSVWRGMIQRCLNPNCSNFPRYGGRGIKICPQWRDFTVFLADVGKRPGPEYSLDRIDNDGDYEPGNVAWRTDKDQANNRNSNTHVTYQEETKTLAQWSDQLGIKLNTLAYRIYTAGWTIERAFSTPVNAKAITK